MARKQSDPSEANKAVLDARQKLQLAKDADAKGSTDKTKAAVKHASEHLSKCIETENRERFVNVGGGRVRKARLALRNLASVGNPRSYSYTQADVLKAKAALQGELDTCIAKLESALTKGGPAKVADDFTF
ncbi:MAG: hypothetical protein KGJ13_05470 [Patescibacteria group bacterium]|nr:hypothetical protein [Patescibacteria group bacterium]